MAITLVVKTAVIDTKADIDTAIATALNSGITYTSIYGISVIPISNTQAKIIIIYA